MSNYQNETKAYLLSVPLENDYKHTLYFNTPEEQENYFKGRKVAEYNDFNFQRKDEPIRVPESDAMGLVTDYAYLTNAGVNYVMYKNAAHENKWIYAFVTDIKYISEGVVEIQIETDVIQTWMFRYTLKPSFVEREHVSDDTVGKHTVPEGIETGDFVCNGHQTHKDTDSLLNDLCYILALTVSTIGEGSGDDFKYPACGGRTYNGIYSGVKYYRFDSADGLDTLIEMIGEYQPDAIVGLFMCPKFLAPNDDSTAERLVAASGSATTNNVSIDKNTTLNGYSPKNKKLLTSAYNYLLASNNNGSCAIYSFEEFKNNSCEFVVKGAITPGCSIRMTPKNYKGATENDEESINLGKYPICSYSVDMYTNWLTQNSVNVAGMQINSDQMAIGGSAIASAMQIMGGIGLMASGGGALAGAGMLASGITGGITGVTGAIMQQKQHNLIPPQANGNINCGDVITASSKNTFHFYYMSIKEEYARICDEYFNMFGYKVNRVKKPNKCHRSRYWYTKTIDVNIDGAIPNKDMQIIKNCYNNGITFWRNASEIQNYNLDNNIAITDGAITDEG